MPTKSHGHSTGYKLSPTYSSWKAMRNRCNNPNADCYPEWGGRGITICKRWNSFANFLADMGERPKDRSLDRIDNNGNYNKENCRWATSVEQTYNKRYPKNRRPCTGVVLHQVNLKWETWVRQDGNPLKIYYGSDLFEACARRKSWELSNGVAYYES